MLFVVEMRFIIQFSTCDFFFVWSALFAVNPPDYIRSSQNSRATLASSPFSYRGKSHGARLRGVDPKNKNKSPQTTKKRAVEILVRVDENVGSVASSYLLLLSKTWDGS